MIVLMMVRTHHYSTHGVSVEIQHTPYCDASHAAPYDAATRLTLALPLPLHLALPLPLPLTLTLTLT